MRVLKFGGTSVSNAECFMHVSEIIYIKSRKEKIAVVLSAPDNITNYLLEILDLSINKQDTMNLLHKITCVFFDIINKLLIIYPNVRYFLLKKKIQKEFLMIKNLLHGVTLINYCPANIQAKIISVGEKLSVIIMEEILKLKDIHLGIINPIDVLVANGSYLESVVDITNSILCFDNHHTNILQCNVILMPGFIAGNKYRELVLLGRNGSDYSAAALSILLKANICEIWTDVQGVFSADPKYILGTLLIPYLSYKESIELSHLGANILHQYTIYSIKQYKIFCYIKYIKNPKFIGTLIGLKSKNIDLIENNNMNIKGITSLNNMVIITIIGIVKNIQNMFFRVFNAIKNINISIFFVFFSLSEDKFELCITERELFVIYNIIKEEFSIELNNKIVKNIFIKYKLSVLSVVIGDRVYNKSKILEKLFNGLTYTNINIISIFQGVFNHALSIIIPNNSINKAIQSVHNILYNKNYSKIIELFIIGTGGVGSALINQIYKQQQYFKNNYNYDIKVCGIANSSYFITKIDGINLKNWKSLLYSSKFKEFDVNGLKNFKKNNELYNPVFVDCTCSDSIATSYKNILLNGFHIVTTNKKSNSSSMQYYSDIRNTAFCQGLKYLYKTHVGAGLPIIESLKNLLYVGDNLIKLSGILSGSLSYIFGMLEDGYSLMDCIISAKNSGFTEPDLCEDFSGKDMARKFLILAREIGCDIELSDIDITPVIPILSETSNDFMKNIEYWQNILKNQIIQAKYNNCVIRYVGTLEKRRCKIQIEFIDKNNPLFTVKNGENALSLLTDNYSPLPLFLRGYGAGNNITAAGVLSDILKIFL